jgi:putative SOS response-associated peptidase YedK
MCGRLTLRALAQDVASLFDVLDIPALSPRYNIAPTQQVLTIGQNAGERPAVFMRWGWCRVGPKTRKIGSNFINPRDETVGSPNVFCDAFHKRRCLIPADGFFEWKADGKGKQPYVFQRVP